MHFYENKVFVCNVRRVRRLSYNNYGTKLVQLAECHLQYRASPWMRKLEGRDHQRSPLEDLKNVMLREFVPSNEQGKAQLRLMFLKIKSALDRNIYEFTELIGVCETPTRDAYSFLFKSLSQYLNGK